MRWRVWVLPLVWCLAFGGSSASADNSNPASGESNPSSASQTSKPDTLDSVRFFGGAGGGVGRARYFNHDQSTGYVSHYHWLVKLGAEDSSFDENATSFWTVRGGGELIAALESEATQATLVSVQIDYLFGANFGFAQLSVGATVKGGMGFVKAPVFARDAAGFSVGAGIISEFSLKQRISIVLEIAWNRLTNHIDDPDESAIDQMNDADLRWVTAGAQVLFRY